MMVVRLTMAYTRMEIPLRSILAGELFVTHQSSSAELIRLYSHPEERLAADGTVINADDFETDV